MGFFHLPLIFPSSSLRSFTNLEDPEKYELFTTSGISGDITFYVYVHIYIYMSTSNPDMRQQCPWRYLPSQSEIIQVIFSYIIIHLHSLYYQSLSLIY